jgi:DNA-binding transcriptional ArsR family regulator
VHEDQGGRGDGGEPEPDEAETGRLLVALQHPTRRRILREMPSEGSISPRKISGLLDEPLSNISYHVRVLSECGAIKLTTTKPVRGSMQHFYTTAIEAEWARGALGLDSDE